MFAPELITLLHINKTVEERVLPVVAFPRKKDRRGYGRLVHAINTHNTERVKRILDVAPESAKIVNKKKKGYTPLHIACMTKGVPVEIIKMLLKVYPEAATIPDTNGNVPLDWEFNWWESIT